MSILKKALLLYYKLRRFILKNFVPKFIWPKEVLIDKVPIRVRDAPYSFGVKYSLTKGDYERNERQLLNNRIKQGEIVFEFGGSIGILTSVLAEKVGLTGMIISVEASGELTRYSKNWLEKKSNIKVVHGYGFPVNRLVQKIIIERFDESGGSLGGLVTFTTDNSSNETDDNIFDLRKLSSKFKLIPNILVIDIEGSEKILVEQLPEFPNEVRMILIEFHPYIYGLDCMNSIIKSIESEGFLIIESRASVYLFERK